jgi:hypothetical protein
MYVYLLAGSWRQEVLLLAAAVLLAYLGNFIRLLKPKRAAGGSLRPAYQRT